MKDKIVELLRYAYLWGRDNGEGRSEKNFNDFLETKEKAIAHLYSAGEEVYVPCSQAEGDIQLPYRSGGVIALKKVTRPTVSEEELAVMFHDAYEDVAKEEGWNTQNKCKVPFDDLPEANKRTMIRTAKIVKELLNR